VEHRQPPAGTNAHENETLAPNADTDSFANTPDDELLTASARQRCRIGFRRVLRAVAPSRTQNSHPGGGGARLRKSSPPGRWLRFPERLSDIAYGRRRQLARARHIALGLWLDRQQRYDRFASSRRLTLTQAFRRAGWDTVGVMPGNDAGWPGAEPWVMTGCTTQSDGIQRSAVQLGQHAGSYTCRDSNAPSMPCRTASRSWQRSLGLQPCALGANPAPGQLGRGR
jgi:hypothetical protein